MAEEITGKYLTFALGREDFGINIVRVREIIKVMEVTEIPNVPDYAKGVINLRDKVIPVIDLRLKFKMAGREYDDRTCIIVVEHGPADLERQIGVVVDQVSEVVAVSAEDTESAPDFGGLGKQAHILAMAKIQGKVKILLDIDHVLGSEEFAGHLSGDEKLDAG